jgi:hypothetical protein
MISVNRVASRDEEKNWHASHITCMSALLGFPCYSGLLMSHVVSKQTGFSFYELNRSVLHVMNEQIASHVME